MTARWIRRRMECLHDSRASLSKTLILAFAVAVLCSGVQAQDAPAFFRANCYSCHTVGGGRVTGPDLKGVLERKEREWLLSFIQNPKAVIDSGDAYALQIMKESRNVIMPTVPGLNQQMAEALLTLVEKESKLEESNFMGLQVSDSPISEADVARGKAYFTGATRLVNRGPACLSCHSAGSTGLLGGGRIGPDLTKVHERLGGRRALASWMLAPATPTMGRVFRDQPLHQDEIPALAAFLEFQAKNETEEPAAVNATFLLFLGLWGASMLLGVIGWASRGRHAAGVVQEEGRPERG